MGCNTPEGLLILADWLDDHGGDGSEFREPMRDIGEMPRDGYGDGNGRGDGDGYGYGFGTEDGDGGPDVTG